MKNNNLYIYLARLDKKGIKVLSGYKFPQKIYPTRINELEKLNLSTEVSSKIAKDAYENRMDYELFIESAASFDELKKSLQKRGYSHLPTHQFAAWTKPTSINAKMLVTKNSTMIRRNSDVNK